MSLPEIVSLDEWWNARKALMIREKEMTRARDKLVADRRRLPMVEIEKDYEFETRDGQNVSLLDLFEGRHQLIVVHFMFDPSWDDGCPSCSAAADEASPGLLDHLHTRDTTMVWVARAPIAKIEDYRKRKGWDIPWVSSYGSDFNYDFHVSFHTDDDPWIYNFTETPGRMPEGMPLELPGRSHFLRDGERIFLTYEVFARGLEQVGGSYYFLDETALGRQEEWEEPKGRAIKERAAVPNFEEG